MVVEREAVLFANETFYRAFADRDVAAMELLWARHCPVACLHPGWGPLVGRDDVMQSWAAILGNPGSPAIVCRDARAFVHGETAFVICFEGLGDDYLIATNIFVRQGSLWKMVHHQAGPTNARPESPAPEPTLKPN